MGYNNNHAGMHMIRYSRYGEYDDLKYYDKLARENKSKEDYEIMQATQKRADTTKKKKHNVKDNKGISEYGTEKIIDMKHFMLPEVIVANILIMSMKNKKDIYEILSQCECEMKKDFRTNASSDVDWSLMPLINNSIIFLSLVAEKLGCVISDFFIDNPSNRKEFVYALIEQIRKDTHLTFDSGDVNEDGSAEFSYSGFDHTYGMSNVVHEPIWKDMALTFYKEIFMDDEISYSVAFGDLQITLNTKFDYMLKGAYLWEEDNGKLKEFIEETLDRYF